MLSYNQKQENKRYQEWFRISFKEWLKSQGIENHNQNEFLNRYGYFVTMTFDPKRIRYRKLEAGLPYKHQTDVEYANFNRFYNEVCKVCAGRRYHKVSRRNDLPFCFIYLDVENSKYKRKFEKDDIKNLHFHAVMVFNDQTFETFENWRSGPRFKHGQLPKILDADEIEIKKISGDFGSVNRLVPYASKFATKSTTTGEDFKDVMIYPLHLHDHRPSTPKLKKRNYQLEKMRELTAKEVQSRREYLKRVAEESKKKESRTLNHFVGL